MRGIFPNDRGFLGDAYSKVAPIFTKGVGVAEKQKDLRSDIKLDQWKKVVDFYDLCNNIFFIALAFVFGLSKASGWSVLWTGWTPEIVGKDWEELVAFVGYWFGVSHFGGGGIMYFFDFLSNRRENRAERLREEAREAERQDLRRGLEKEFAGDQGGMEKIEKVFNGR